MTEIQSPSTSGKVSRGQLMWTTLAALAHLALVSAAIETFSSGSPVRWWVLGLVVGYMAGLAVVWRFVPAARRHITAAELTTSGAGLLLGLIVLTTWMPGGLTNGIRVFGVSTPTLLALISIVAIGVAADVVRRATGVPRIMRWALLGIAAYAALAFAAATIQNGVAALVSFAGGGPRAVMSFWGLGALLGTFVFAPSAILLVLLGRVHRSVTPARGWSRLVILTLPLLIAASALAGRAGRSTPSTGTNAGLVPAELHELKAAAAQQLTDIPRTPVALEDPQLLLERARSAADSYRPEAWEVPAAAASLKSVEAAFELVRDAIGFDPYAGVLRGAEGALAARAGNAWDRALLLKALLVESGHTARFAFCALDKSTAAALLKRAQSPPARTLSQSGAGGAGRELAARVQARARRDDAALRLSLADRLAHMGVDDTDMLLQDVTHHVWVQLQRDDGWVDLDPTMPDARIGDVLAPAAETSPDLSPAHQDIVVVRIVAEFLTDDRLSLTVPLERELVASTAADQYLLLEFVPERGRKGGLTLGAGDGRSFVPTLWINGDAQRGTSVSLGGGDTSGGLDVFGGSEASDAELVGLSVEIETRVPGHAPTVARHVLLDRLRPEAREVSHFGADAIQSAGPVADSTRALSGFHHILISTGGISPYDLAEMRVWAVEAAVRADEPAVRPRPLAKQVWPLWVCDLVLVDGSERLVLPAIASSGFSGRAYVGEPRVFLVSWFPEPETVSGMSRETDLLIDSMHVLPSQPDGSRPRAETLLWYGALQSALETETALSIAEAWDPSDRTVISTSLSMHAPLTVLDPSDAAGLPPGSAPSLKHALRGGDLVLVPGPPQTARTWWTVAPSGFLRAIVDPGPAMAGIGGTKPPGGKPPGGKPPREPKPERPKREPPKVNQVDKSRIHERKPRRRNPILDYFKDEFEAGPSPGTEYQLVLGVSEAVQESVSYFGTDAVKRVVSVSANGLGLE